MPNELTIQPINPLPASGEAATEPKTDHLASPPANQTAPPAQSYTNPALRLDPALGLIVIEFRNDAGSITSTIPSERQLEAYRMHQEAVPGETPRRDSK